jgi:Family of unknown function (DUF5994)
LNSVHLSGVHPAAGLLAWPEVRENVVLSTTGREAAISSAQSARLELKPDQRGPTVLDGGWWPRSEDPATELPDLIRALDERHGRTRRIMLGAADWTASRPRQLVFGAPENGRVVHLGWFDTQPAGLLTAISATGQRTDLLTVPPDTSEPEARKAMDQAAEAGNQIHAPAILAIITAAASAPASGPDLAPAPAELAGSATS